MSISWLISGLQLGISNVRLLFFVLILNPNAKRIFFVSFAVIEKPIVFLNLFKLNSIFFY